MRVGLNATCFNDRPSGARQRFHGIYGALVRQCPDMEFVVYEPADCAVGSWFDGAPNVVLRKTPLPSGNRIARALHGLAYWRGAFKRDKLDLFEAFHLPLVRAPDCPTILTVHDARPVLKEVPLVKRMFFGGVLRHALRHADQVVTVSQRMREEILALEPTARVATIYNGIDASKFDRVSPADAERTRARLGLPADFILAVGHLEARKNYPRLIGAIASLRQTGRAVSLVIVGNDGGASAAVAGEAERHGLADHVTILEGVSDSELADIYALCSLVVFPSYYEGFGIPVLEAMAARRPLVLSDIPVFRELTENQGAYFPAHDGEAMAAAIGDLLTSEDRRQALISYGNDRVRQFEFPQLAAQVERVYRAFL